MSVLVLRRGRRRRALAAGADARAVARRRGAGGHASTARTRRPPGRPRSPRRRAATTSSAPGSDRGNEVLAHVAAQLDLPFAANVTEVDGDERDAHPLGRHAARGGAAPRRPPAPHRAPRSRFAARDRCRRSHGLVTACQATAVAVVDHVAPDTGGKVSLARREGRRLAAAAASARRKAFAILEELAALLDAAVGCSRVVTSAGWRPHSDQVGQTGTKVSPDLYIACGISGATQHIAGCKGAKTLLAINADREATIFAHADYAVIGDLHEIVPAITRRAQEGQRLIAAVAGAVALAALLAVAGRLFARRALLPRCGSSARRGRSTAPTTSRAASGTRRRSCSASSKLLPAPRAGR